MIPKCLRHPQFLATVVLVTSTASIVLVLAPGSGAYRPRQIPRYQHLTKQDSADRFLSYDGKRSNAKDSRGIRYGGNRDFPITMIFYGSGASRPHAQQAVGYGNSGSREWEPYRLSRNAHARIVGDGGAKSSCRHGSDTHIRFYGSRDLRYRRFSDPIWGYFVVASTHLDHGEDRPGCRAGSKWFGYSEGAAHRVETSLINNGYGCRGCITEDYIQLHNKETLRFGGHHREHIWRNDGKATVVYLP